MAIWLQLPPRLSVSRSCELCLLHVAKGVAIYRSIVRTLEMALTLRKFCFGPFLYVFV